MPMNTKRPRLRRFRLYFFAAVLMILVARQYSNSVFFKLPDFLAIDPPPLHLHPLSTGNENITEADLLNRCCIRYNESDNTARKVNVSCESVYGGWDFQTSNRSDPNYSLNLATFGGPGNPLIFSLNNTWDEANNWNNIPKSTPLMYAPLVPFNHPAHCIQDVVFSMLPMAYRGELKGVALVQFDTTKNRQDGYCSQIVKALNWFDKIIYVPNNACLEKLWVPAIMHYRFPSKVRHGSVKRIANSNGYLHKDDLPVDMLSYLQRKLWSGVGVHHDYGCKKPIILIESRIGLKWRIWKNAHSIGEMLRAKYNREVKIVDDWSGLSVKEQANIFHSASVFIGPHSGSNANLIFMRKGSVVLEIHCTGEIWARDWLIDLGINHISVLPDDPPCTDHNEEEMSVKNTTILDLVSKVFDSDQNKSQFAPLIC